ncbi:hypothetical protein [Thermogemmatispora tikiterensis]|uniref:Uncharacterized protein n=1 Tax=Thermogemmatispora tikiterensis TaxID=1825093 RepID=A0A328VFH9_9CHLR|nr:hypothetical protein [Thermogemmatispora tikiterensis]RAQ94074.1 hypothetical protein A4R35_00920 [Thermogemmatispora tikiterensis]
MVWAGETSFRRTRALIDLAEALALTQRTEEAERVWRAVEEVSQQAVAACFWRARAQTERATARARIQASEETAQAMRLGKRCEEVAFVRRLKELLAGDSALQGETLARADAAAHGNRPLRVIQS